tara:strand:+ start:569 stop:1135 length:567 start_codon:yes stop_codon:yes gene_type:complete
LDQKIATGVEPHYHDNDEFWLFTDGVGEVWLDKTCYDITPNTLVYTPMGCIHRFQMFSSYENNAIVTRLEREQRPIHVTVDNYGWPEKTVQGFVISGSDNKSPIDNPGPRCPLSEWRQMALEDGETIEELELHKNEHWMLIKGKIGLELDGVIFESDPQDVALLSLRHPEAIDGFGWSADNRSTKKIN